MKKSSEAGRPAATHQGRAPNAPSTTQLSARQRGILRLLGEGKTSGEIAEALGLSPFAITYHRARIRQLLHLGSEWELIRFAILAAERRTM